MPPGGHAAYKSPERYNWMIQLLYTRQEFDECLKIVEKALTESRGLNARHGGVPLATLEFPLYIKAMILRQQGSISELKLFQSATCLNPGNLSNLKQVGHSLYLLGKHRQALDVYKEAMAMGPTTKSSSKGGGAGDDWELWHNSGLCYVYLKDHSQAIECFEHANHIGRHDTTFHELGQVYQRQANHREALKVYQDALDFSPENSELLCTVGLTYLRLKQQQRAFDFLGNALTHDPRNAKAILAAGSIIQDNGEMDIALHKYRVAAVQTPHSAQLWNNVGMALFGKGKHVAAVSCLRRALYIDPFEWIISYNLGLVHLHTGQTSTAFHHFSTAAALEPATASTYMYLGVALSRLGDTANCDAAFKKALALQDDHLMRLNYAICLLNHGDHARALDEYTNFENLIASVSDIDPDDESLQFAQPVKKAFLELGLLDKEDSFTSSHTKAYPAKSY